MEGLFLRPSIDTNRQNFVFENDYIRASTLELIANEIYDKNIGGSVAELGVYRGDFAKIINIAFPDRKLYLFDTFEGFDKRDIKTELENKYSKGDQNFSESNIELVLNKMKGILKFLVQPDRLKQGGTDELSENYVRGQGGNFPSAL
ncbi:MAG: TylF/MycF family methyltransferase [Treponema sp.]|nr:TylF/MycF family methyltransferase [Treponema sp.]